MPFDAGTAQGKLDLDSSGFSNALTSAQTALGGFLNKAGGLANKALTAGLVVGIGAATAAAATFAAALVNGSRQQAEYERAVVGLSNVLDQRGVPGFKNLVAGVEEYATAIQRLTGVQTTTTLSIAKFLSVAGVAPESLRSATQVVLDFAAATGVDAGSAARLFGQTLQGNGAAIARYLPQVKSLTAEQLKAGAAFQAAAEATQGQAEALGETFTGRLQRLAASIDDFIQLLGKAFNDAFGPLVTEVQGALDEITDRLGQGVGLELLQQAATTAAETLRNLFVGALTLGPDLINLFINLSSIIAIIATAAGKLGQILAIAFGAFDTADTIGRLTDGLISATEQALKFRDELEKADDILDATIDPSRSLKENIAAIADAFGLTRKEAERTRQVVDEVKISTSGAAASAKKILDLWKAVNESAVTTAGSVDIVEQETEGAANAAESLAASFDDVASSAATATAEVNKQIASLSASRTFVSRTTLDFSDPFAAQAQASQAFQQLGNTGISAFAGATLLNAARQFADGVRNAAQASFDRAFADFTAQVLAELNAAGIFDPAERSRILRERIAEAQRFGILPMTRAVQVF